MPAVHKHQTTKSKINKEHFFINSFLCPAVHKHQNTKTTNSKIYKETFSNLKCSQGNPLPVGSIESSEDNDWLEASIVSLEEI